MIERDQRLRILIELLLLEATVAEYAAVGPEAKLAFELYGELDAIYRECETFRRNDREG